VYDWRKKNARVWDSVLPLVCSFCSYICLHNQKRPSNYKIRDISSLEVLSWFDLFHITQFEADRRAFIITINSFGTELGKDDRNKLYPKCGKLYPEGLSRLAKADDYEQVRAVADYYSVGSFAFYFGLFRAIWTVSILGWGINFQALFLVYSCRNFLTYMYNAPAMFLPYWHHWINPVLTALHQIPFSKHKQNPFSAKLPYHLAFYWQSMQSYSKRG